MNQASRVKATTICVNVKKPSLTGILNSSALVVFAISAVYILLQLIMSKFSNPAARLEHLLMLLQCIVGIVAVNIPKFLNRRLKIEIPTAMEIMFTTFLFCAIFLGEVAGFYYKIPFWDDLLHLSSGIITGFLGCILMPTEQPRKFQPSHSFENNFPQKERNQTAVAKSS